MPDWVRSRLVRLLFHLVDTARVKTDGDDIESWLADNWGHPGFRQYVAQRDFLIVRELAGGDQLTAPDHRKVWQMSGQRVELLKLGQQAKRAWEKRDITKRSR